jgi:hypothetical protein
LAVDAAAAVSSDGATAEDPVEGVAPAAQGEVSVDLASDAVAGDIAGALADSAKVDNTLPSDKTALALNLEAAEGDVKGEAAYHCFHHY